MKDVNLYLNMKLGLDNAVKRRIGKDGVAQVWDKHFHEIQTAHVRSFLQSKGILRPQDKLTVKAVNKSGRTNVTKIISQKH